MAQNRIRELRRGRGLTVVALAEKVDISHGYLTRIENGKRGLSVELAEKLAMALGTDPQDVLGLKKQPGADPEPSRISQFSEDCEPYVAGPTDLPVPKRPNVDPWRVKSNALDQVHIYAGDVVLVDVSAAAVEALQPLQCVVAQVYDSDPQVLVARTVMRQFVPPALLITNSSTDNEVPLRLDTEQVAVKGVIVGTQRSFRA